MVSYIPNLNKIVSCTTRPKREYEIDGKNYYFITKEDFLGRQERGEMLETSYFKDWYYGTCLSSLDINKINVGVFSPMVIKSLLDNPYVEVLPIWIRTEDKIRLMRSLLRESNPDCVEICRRFFADLADFSNIDFHYYNIVNNENFNREMLKYYISNFDRLILPNKHLTKTK